MSEGAIARVVDISTARHTPPALADDEAERAVLGAVLLDGDDACGVWRRVSPVLEGDDFADPAHGAIWEAFAAVHDRGERLDVLTASAELRRRNRLNTIGGPQYLGELTDDVVTTVHAEAHAALVKVASLRRRLVVVGQRLALAAADPSKDPERVRDLAAEALRGVRFGRSGPSSALALVSEVWSQITAVGDARPRVLATGVPTIDRMTSGGLKRGGCYFLASRPGIGKTTLTCQIGGAVADRGEGVLYVALEPSPAEVMQTTLACRAGVEVAKIARDTRLLSQGDLDALAEAGNAVSGWPLHVVDGADTVARVEAAMRSLPSMPALVVVDHLLKLNAAGRHEKPHHATAEVVSGLVALGKRTGATFVVLCHIGRGMSSTAGLYRRPRPEDVAGGDAINRDADGLLILHREDKYPTKKENVENPLIGGHVDVWAPKLRGAEDNTFGRMLFRGSVQRFDEFRVTPNAPELDSEGNVWGGS
jgi:replicative DNA helicase